MTPGEANGDMVPLRELLSAETQHLRELFEAYVENTERRLEALNHLRLEVMQDRSTFITQAYYNAKHEDLDRRLLALDKAVATTAAASASVDALKAQEKRTLWLSLGLAASLMGAATDLVITLIKHW